jgi:hypothetical protein
MARRAAMNCRPSFAPELLDAVIAYLDDRNAPWRDMPDGGCRLP